MVAGDGLDFRQTETGDEDGILKGLEHLRATLSRARRGQEHARSSLSRHASSAEELAEPASALAAEAESSWLDVLSQGNKEIRSTLTRRLRDHRKSLLAGLRHPILELLAGRVALLSLEVEWLELQSALAFRENLDAQNSETSSPPSAVAQQARKLYPGAYRAFAATTRLFANVSALLGHHLKEPNTTGPRVNKGLLPNT